MTETSLDTRIQQETPTKQGNIYVLYTGQHDYKRLREAEASLSGEIIREISVFNGILESYVGMVSSSSDNGRMSRGTIIRIENPDEERRKLVAEKLKSESDLNKLSPKNTRVVNVIYHRTRGSAMWYETHGDEESLFRVSYTNPKECLKSDPNRRLIEKALVSSWGNNNYIFGVGVEIETKRGIIKSLDPRTIRMRYNRTNDEFTPHS